MKGVLLVCLALLFALPGFAQIELEKGDMPKKGKTYTVYEVPDSSTWRLGDSLDLGVPGANGTYDFSYLSSIPADTLKRRISDPAALGFDKQHPNANGAMWGETDVTTYREPLKFTDSDLPDKQSTFRVREYESYNHNLNISINDVVDWDNDGPNSYYDFTAINKFNDSVFQTSYMDPKATHWSSKYGGARAAKLMFTDTDSATGDTTVQLYQFYELDNGNFVNHGVGIKLDESFLSQTPPSGNFMFLDAEVKPKRTARLGKFTLGDQGLDSSTWSVTATVGTVELRHTEIDRTWWRVNGQGVLFLPRDSFQVVMMVKRHFQIRFDSVYVMGNLTSIDVDIDTFNQVQYFTRGIADPIVSCYASPNFQSIGNVQVVDTINTMGFTKERTDTVMKLFSMLNLRDNKLEMVGLSALFDQQSLIGTPSGIIDTLTAVFDKPSVIVSTDFKNGYSYNDTFNWSVTFNPNQDLEMRMHQRNARSATVDGYGKLMINGGTVDVIRVKTIDTTFQTNRVYQKGQLVQTEHDTDATFQFEYWAKRNGLPLVTVETNEGFDEIWKLEYTASPFPVGTEVPNGDGIAVYPNPANGFLVIEAEVSANKTLRLFNLSGQMVRQLRLSKQKTILNTDDWAPGLYFVQVLDRHSGASQIEKVEIR